MSRLSEARVGSGIGAIGVTLVDVLSYREDLQALIKGDCDRCFGGLAEGYYPIDVEYAPTLTAAAIPADPDDLIDWESGMERARGIIGRWRLAVLGRNSD